VLSQEYADAAVAVDPGEAIAALNRLREARRRASKAYRDRKRAAKGKEE
jgi:hypothetical protein